MKNCFYVLLVIVAILPASLCAQTIVAVSSDPVSGGGNLNTAVSAAITAGTLSTTVFQLDAYGFYILTGPITVPAGTHLTIVAPTPTSTSGPAEIVWTAGTSVTTSFNFDCFGDITLKNVYLMYANTGGTQKGSSLEIEDDSVTNALGQGEHAYFEGVMFDYAPCPANASGAIGVSAQHFRGTFKNCYFRNCIDPHLRYYGRAVSFPYNTTGWHNDSLSFENCTFANMGYVYMQEGGEYSDYVSFNHCTFLNVMEFPIESGWWHTLSVTNSIFVNTWMLGDIPISRGDTTYPGSGTTQPGNYPNGGTVNIDSIGNFGFSPNPAFTESQRHVLFTNSSYFIEDWLTTYMKKGNNAYSDTASLDNLPYPQPMMSTKTMKFFDSLAAGGQTKLYPYMNRKSLYQWSNPKFNLPPTNTSAIETYLLNKWTTNADLDWSYNIADDIAETWPVNEDLSYTNDTLKTAAMGGFPLGDLYNWWPTQYSAWSAQSATEHAAISNWLANGIVADVAKPQAEVAENFSLSQNYPNPFNPTTEINYSLAKNGYVTLKVFDLIGREVTTLYAGVQSAGNHVVTFNAGKFSSGVYFYRLQVDGNSITKKLILMK